MPLRLTISGSGLEFGKSGFYDLIIFQFFFWKFEVLKGRGGWVWRAYCLSWMFRAELWHCAQLIRNAEGFGMGKLRDMVAEAEMMATRRRVNMGILLSFFCCFFIARSWGGGFIF